MGARSFELDEETDEAFLLANVKIMVDALDYPVAKHVPYSRLRVPIRTGEVSHNAAYTLVPGDHGNLLPFTVAATLTVPIAAALGTGFRVQVYADGVAVTINRSGGGSFVLAAGELVSIITANGKVLYYKHAGAAVL